MESSDYDDEPTEDDLRNHIAENEAYIRELYLARTNLRSLSLYWYVAALFAFTLAIGLILLLFVQVRGFDWLVPQTAITQTVLTSLLTMVLCAAVSSFMRFVSLRRLAAEATEIVEANKAAVGSAYEMLQDS